jgi:MoxR-like ATPase
MGIMTTLRARKGRSQYKFVRNYGGQPENPHEDCPRDVEPYVTDDLELEQAVNLAIHLQRPLLLEGEAGCGKTKLAETIAFQLGLPFYRWDIRSTSLAKEGLYEYDALLRLHDVQAVQAKVKVVGRDAQKTEDYVRYGALGKAFRLSDRPAVVLIDEIDKADLDFPNDLLTVLERPWSFEVPEAIQADDKPLKVGPALHPPIVIITSNREKTSLPLPFLRRCIYYYMKFPDRTGLENIVKAHYGEPKDEAQNLKQDFNPVSDELVKATIDRFLALRNTEGLFKKPGTSEFLDWMDAIVNVNVENSGRLLAALQDDGKVPFRELLFKVQKDWQKFNSAKWMGEG